MEITKALSPEPSAAKSHCRDPRRVLRSTPRRFCLAALALVALAGLAKADTFTFTNAAGDNQYTTGGNWLDNTTNTSGAVPNLQTANTAQINSGAARHLHPRRRFDHQKWRRT